MRATRPVGLVVAVLMIGSACTLQPRAAGDDPDPASTPIDLEQDDSPASTSPTADVVAEVLPSVVNVRVTALQQDITVETQEAEGQGSGVVIDPSGVILTNNHVVECALEVEVVFTDERDALSGEIVGTVPEKDLAVIRVEADDLDAIELGNSSRLRLGDDVLALGFPLGLGGPTVTRGIVSGKDRDVSPAGPSGTTQLDGLLQTDAAINPGNSGGALVDEAGRLVGINTAAAQASQAENIGFAIPIDAAIPVVEEILREPADQRAWLGVSIASVDSAAAAGQLGLDGDVRGVVVLGLFEGPAAGAGIVEGDVITQIEDEDIGSVEDLSDVLSEFDPGDEVAIRLMSPEGDRTVDVTLAQRPVAC